MEKIRHYIILIAFSLITLSCNKNELSFLIKKDDLLLDNYPAEVKFKITGTFLENKGISCIETDTKGNVWIASGNELYHFKDDLLVNSDTLEFRIRDLSCAGDESLWIGSEGGLAHFESRGITWYTKEKYNLPRDLIFSVLVDWDGKIWLSSYASNIGGLLVYDGNNFTEYAPGNTDLNPRDIPDIHIDHKGSIYLYATTGKVNHSNIFRFSDNMLERLRDADSTFYWINGFGVGPAGTIYLLEDFTLAAKPHPNIYEYKNNIWRKLPQPEFYLEDGLRPLTFTSLEVDKRNYCWLAQVGIRGISLRVFDGSSWLSSQQGLFPDNDWISCMTTDYNNNIWIGTSKHGVIKLDQ